MVIVVELDDDDFFLRLDALITARYSVPLDDPSGLIVLPVVALWGLRRIVRLQHWYRYLDIDTNRC
jgi:hypothetical protein